MRSILVTGGAGFIGSHLSRRLLEGGGRVVVLDNFDPYYDEAIKRGNLEDLVRRERFELVEGDIRDRDEVDRVFADGGFQAVIHLAAKAGVRPSIADPEGYASVNLVGTTVLLEACRRHDVPTFVFGSSSSVYGNNSKVPFSEDDPVDHPISPYAATKKAGEVLCHAHHHLHGLAVSCLRFFTVYGPGQRPEMAIHKFARLLDAGEPVPRFGDGSTARDYTYVDDIVDGIVRALDRTRTYHVWNLGGSNTVTLSDLIEKIAAGLGKPAVVRELPMQPGDVDSTWADVGRAERELGWRPAVGIDEGIRRFLDWFRGAPGA
jgi:UDP-glucuronate 4-epimerase